jgi:pimeloyl-ACP methyl ester carboxylesterase
MSIAPAAEIELDVGGVTLAAKRWRNGDTPVIALHGWLDNAASFDRLAPLLENADVVALDLAGHGHSYHRTLQSAYNIWDDLPDILRAADQLGWQQFHLVGHSRGAIISAILTATMPERVLSSSLLDGFRPDPVAVADTFKQLTKFLHDHASAEIKLPTRYDTFERALQVRTRVSGMREDSAAVIVERGLKREGDEWLWRTDPRLQLASAIKLSAEQIQLMESIISQRPCKLWLAESGMARWIHKRVPLESIPISLRVLEGSHHFHMEEQAEILAREIIEFWRAL